MCNCKDCNRFYSEMEATDVTISIGYSLGIIPKNAFLKCESIINEAVSSYQKGETFFLSDFHKKINEALKDPDRNLN